MFFLFRYLGANGNKMWVRIGALVLIAGLIALRVTAASSHNAWSGTLLVVVVIATLAARLTTGRRRLRPSLPSADVDADRSQTPRP